MYIDPNSRIIIRTEGIFFFVTRLPKEENFRYKASDSYDFGIRCVISIVHPYDIYKKRHNKTLSILLLNFI